jgi:hypothetical protein
MESKKVEAESGMMVASAWNWGKGQIGERVISRYKI